MTAADKFARQRERMVREQLSGRLIRNPLVLDAMLSVPRHRFVPEIHRAIAYDDRPIAIGKRQTISQPYIVALMTQLLQLEGGETVLEIGTGSGYQAAVLAQIAGQVYTIERHQRLAEQAAVILGEMDYDNVIVHHSDGSGGWPEHSPYDGILVTAAAPEVPRPLLEQLAEGGRLVLPVGDVRGQHLEVWIRAGAKYDHESIAPVAFVPLRGEHGWARDWDDLE